MRSILLVGLALVASATAVVEVQKNYHDAVGIPLAAKIKTYEDGLTEKEKLDNRVVGGAFAPAGAQPYFGGLLINLLSGTQSVCGSSLLSHNRAVTAAHCWFDGTRQGFMLTVILDSNFLFTGGTRIASSQVVMHPQWNFSTLNNDVAIIYLPMSVLFSARIQPINLPLISETWETFTGHWGLATGFGKTSDSQTTAQTVLSNVNLQIISFDDCRWRFSAGYVVESTLCTSGLGGVGICGGDSGGPLVVHYNGRLVLVGISSFVAQTGCQLGFPSAFARVTSFRNFIVQHL